jgi:hypothetical protein
VAHTTVRATESARARLLSSWGRVIFEPPFKCHKRGLAGELLLGRLEPWPMMPWAPAGLPFNIAHCALFDPDRPPTLVASLADTLWAPAAESQRHLIHEGPALPLALVTERAMPALIYLTSLEELALRQLGSQSPCIAPNSARLLVRLALAEVFRDGWRLTPLGLQRYRALPKSPLQGRKPPPLIDNILNRAIPFARAAGIATPGRGDDAE